MANGNVNAEYLPGMPASDTLAEEIEKLHLRMSCYACAVFVWHVVRLYNVALMHGVFQDDAGAHMG